MDNDFSELNNILQYFAVETALQMEQDVGITLSTLTSSADTALSWILILDHN